MMLRVNGEYLDFDEDIEVDRQVKLFEEIDATAGDFSYSFNVPWTSKNIKALGFPFPDNRDKTVYQTNDAEIIGDDGITIFRGSVRPEIVIEQVSIQCSFFSGNSNWFLLLSGDMSSLNLSRYDVEQTEENIRNSWPLTSGIVWPILDTGGLITRSNADLKTEDFTPCFYVKTLMFELFQQSGLKITGELLKDPLYNSLIVASNGRSIEEINNRSAYALKDVPQALSSSSAIVTWDNDSLFPYFNGSQNNFDLSTGYNADIKMSIQIDLNVTFDLNQLIPPAAATAAVEVYIDGVVQDQYPVFDTNPIFTRSLRYSLSANQTLSIRSFYGPTTSSGSITQATIKVTPIYLYKAFGNAAAPKLTKQEFVNNIFSVFNVIPAYDSYSKTIILNLFEGLKHKEPIDISDYITNIETDYTEFISDYGKKNNFFFQETDIDNLNEYNVSTFLKYGTGVITVNNDYLQQSVDILESDFASPISYINGAFDMSMERIQFVEYDTENSEITDVSTPGFGIARFGVTDDIFEVNDLVRISESTNSTYNGDWLVVTVGSGFIQCSGPVFDTDSTATIEKLIHKFTTEDNVYLFLNIPNYSIAKASGLAEVFVNDNFYFNASIAYFNLLNTNRQINKDFKQGLSFGEIDNPLFYQRTILETYWPTFQRILNDPVKLRADANFPWKIHNDIDFLRPIMIKTLETTNLYYLNLERGYKNSSIPTEIELIKLP